MILLVRVVLGLIALFFLVGAGRFMLTPEAMGAEFAVSADGATGLSTIRGDLGGAFLAIAIFVGLGLATSTRWLKAAAVLLGAVALGRAVGFAFDGFTERAVIAFAIEIVFVVLILIGARRLDHG
jgi:hypothetical protein